MPGPDGAAAAGAYFSLKEVFEKKSVCVTPSSKWPIDMMPCWLVGPPETVFSWGLPVRLHFGDRETEKINMGSVMILITIIAILRDIYKYTIQARYSFFPHSQ